MNAIEQLKQRFDSYHALALEKGWWDGYKKPITPDQVAAKLALVHTEVAEAKQAARSGEMFDRCREDEKPEGLPSELADVIIRVGDLCGFMGIVDDVVRCLCRHRVNELGSMEHLARDLWIAAGEDEPALKSLAYEARDFITPSPLSSHLGAVGVIGVIDEQVSAAVEAVRSGEDHTLVNQIAGIVRVTMILSHSLRANIASALDTKHAYNATRSRRHGGKRL